MFPSPQVLPYASLLAKPLSDFPLPIRHQFQIDFYLGMILWPTFPTLCFFFFF